jgi:hypothetical protein
MAKKWLCPHCDSLNSLITRYCSNCSKSIVDLKQHVVDAEDSDDQNHSFPVILTNSDADDDITIPREGDLISPLLDVTNDVLAGVINKNNFKDFLETIYGNIDTIFDEILEDLNTTFIFSGVLLKK